ncbi:N-acylneuraminate-9-phosphatase [Asbolus verrucosus]|uniref:N-acylneuraminate-9-phosphatase n=1 Tax=Asbolus verrucosus TaxID=1661398 RepID=A0A482V4B6_ASBVE|nr:N-acylneuraminate-9-phosphatase [Asbolus verrucosus]
MRRQWLAQILWERWGVALEVASNVCKAYLRAFRKCPENLSMSLDSWRRMLWAQALGDQYNKLAGEVYQTWLQLRYDYLALTPEVQNLLQKLRQHYFVGLITNGTSRAQWEKIERLHLRSFFDVVLVSGDLPWEKPHHKIFHVACDYLGVKPQQCIMVGDKLETDILGGAEANLGGTVWVPLSDIQVDGNLPQPDHVIEHVTDLPDLLPKNPKVPRFRRNSRTLRVSLPDFEDGNSNSSDGS